MANFKQVIGKKISERRINMGFKTQAALAERVGVDTGRVNKWENGKFLPDPASRKALCEALEVDESFFFAVDEEKAQSLEVERARLLLELFSLLPTLSDDQIGAILSLCRTAERKNTTALAGSRDTA